MDPALSVNLIPILVAGALAGAFALGFWLGSRRNAGSPRLERNLAIARTEAEAEKHRRQEAESEGVKAQETIRKLDRDLAVAMQRGTLFQEARQDLQDTFEALAHRALKGNAEEFFALAAERLRADRGEAGRELDERKKTIENLVQPLTEGLQKLDLRTAELERARTEAYSRLDEQVLQLAKATEGLQERTTSLASALRGSETRGRWGEITLRNVAELAGMSRHCDFVEQLTLDDGGRPDMVVHLPGGRHIAVDAKAPLTAYLEAQETSDGGRRDAALDRHARAVRDHVKKLAARGYADGVAGDLDLVVLFLPGDPFLAAAFERDPNLQVDALRQKILIATPTTLVALLRTMAIYWQQSSMVENAEAIAAAARELYERAAKFGEDLTHMGRGLTAALQAYNRAVGSYDRRLMPMGRRLEEMMVTLQTRRDLAGPPPIEGTVRPSTEAADLPDFAGGEGGSDPGRDPSTEN